MWKRIGIGLGLLAVAAAQQAPYTFHANTRLVIETVTVTDKAGHPVTGLTAKDFVITENGVPQTVASSDFQRLTVPAAPASVAAAPPPSTARQKAAPSVTTFQITPESAGDTRYNGRRLVVLYFDLTAMPQPMDQLRALDAARRFVSTQMQPADLMAVLTYQGAGVRVNQDFTSDKDALAAAIDKITLAVGLEMSGDSSDADSADTGSAFGEDASEFNVFNDNRQLAALRNAIQMLAPISEKKSLVYFASGMRLNQTDNQAQLESTTNEAVRDNVALFPIDARGLVASAPLGDASQGSPGGVSMYNGQAALAMNLRQQQSQDTLYALGADTGGKALLDTNNLGTGIARARDAITSYYILSYYTSNGALDGKYRKVKISVLGRADVRVAYRTGYYGGKVFAKFTEADRERQLEDALQLGDPITDLTLSLEANYFQLNSAEYFVPIAVKVPGSELVLAKSGGAHTSRLDFIGEVKDAYGTTISNFRDHVEMKLDGETAAQLASAPVEYTAGFTLLPDKYTIKVLARDDETGRIGTYIANITVPNLARQSVGLPLSSVVLGSQRVALAAAAFNASKHPGQSAAEAANPLVDQGVELLPNVTHVFHRAQPLYIYLQAYEHGAASTNGGAAVQQPLVAYVGFYQGGKKVFETAPVRITGGMEGRAQAVPIRLETGLGTLGAGKYTCQITVLDGAKQLAGFWRGQIEVAP
ncbi:MAG TPA: VWA domain-containing protein [Terriglobales bacterium]|jgi:VWFA-related protein